MIKSTIYRIAYIIVVSFLISVGLGLADYETQSLWHLFTGDAGNLLALLMYTFIFSTIGITLFSLMHSLKKIMS